MPLIGADVGGAALGAEDAVEVGPGHAGRAPGGTGGGARINRHRAALEMVIPGHIPGVVHKQGVELGSRERHGARLGARDQVHAPAGAVIDNVVVEHVVGADGGPFIDAIGGADRKSTRLNSSHDQISYAVFCLKKKKKSPNRTTKSYKEHGLCYMSG